MTSPRMPSENEVFAGTDQPQLSDPEAIIMGSDLAVLKEIVIAMSTRVRDLHLSKAMHLLLVDGEISEIRSSLLGTIHTANCHFGSHFMDNCIRSAVANPVHKNEAVQLLTKGAMTYRIAKDLKKTAVIIDNRPKG